MSSPETWETCEERTVWVLTALVLGALWTCKALVWADFLWCIWKIILTTSILKLALSSMWTTLKLPKLTIIEESREPRSILDKKFLKMMPIKFWVKLKKITTIRFSGWAKTWKKEDTNQIPRMTLKLKEVLFGRVSKIPRMRWPTSRTGSSFLFDIFYA